MPNRIDIYFREDCSRAWMPQAASIKIPQPKITAKSYFDYVDHDFYGRDVRFFNWDKRKFTDPDYVRAALKTNPDYGPTYMLPALAVWHRTKEPASARLVVEGIRAFACTSKPSTTSTCKHPRLLDCCTL